MTIRNRTNASNRGQTIVQVVVAVAVVGMAVVLAIAAAGPKGDRAAKIAQCANNLRLLAAAAHCYADDFGGKFFPEAGHSTSKDESPPPRWFDRDRVGRYLQGVELQWDRAYLRGAGSPPSPEKPFVNDAGLGGGVFHCPADVGGLTIDVAKKKLVRSERIIGIRSYQQNYWASGLERSATAGQSKDNGNQQAAKTQLLNGQFFDSN